MSSGYLEYEIPSFLDWLEKQKAKYKIFIAGNHDRYFELFPFICKDILQYFPNITYLENSGITIEGLNIWGTPDTKYFCNWAFNRSSKQLERIADAIPDNTNILISHGPAYHILDKIPDGNHVGEKSLLRRVSELKDLKLHCSGHIHCAYGIDRARQYIASNASVVNEEYNVTNLPNVFEL